VLLSKITRLGLELNTDQSQILIHNMCLGDGTFVKSILIDVCIIPSDKLADDFMRLHTGWSQQKDYIFPQARKNIIKGRKHNIT
jgi:hypothetical protein